MPKARRSHRKVRTGCLQCKKRRIKCDEQRPSCLNCVQHSIECVFAEISWPSISVKAHASLSSPQNATVPGEPVISLESQPQSNFSGNELANIRFMHHFTTSTCQTLSADRELQRIWRVKVPQLAFEHHYLLQVILAVSSLHMCRQLQSTQHKSYAIRQYEASLRQSSLALSHLSSSNCHALYAFSLLALIFELGTLRSRKSLLINDDGSLMHWITHSRGVHAIIGASWKELSSGLLKELLQCEFRAEGHVEIASRLDEFVRHHRRDFPVKVSRVYLDTITELIHWSKLARLGFFGWLCKFSDDYGVLLSQRDPYALIIFGYSCVLLKYQEPAYWIDGCAERLIQEVYGYLNTSLRSWLYWPLDQLGFRDYTYLYGDDYQMS